MQHSMITRSKKKQLDLAPPGNTGDNDEMDESLLLAIFGRKTWKLFRTSEK